MKRIVIVGAALATLGLTACGSDTDNTPYADPNCKASAWQNNKIPPCTIPVNIAVDDTANGVYRNAEAQWKGAFMYDAVTRVAFRAPDWNGGNGPFAPLYDDGPWSGYASGNTILYGHEPTGAVAGDHVLGATMFVYPPATGSETYEYGMVDHAFGDGWIWKGGNGSFTVTAGATSVNATGMTLSPFGTIDMRLSLDTTGLEPNTCAPAPCTPAAWDFAGGVKVKGSAWGWYEVPVASIGGGVYQFVLSDFAGLGKQLYHTGLTASLDEPQFVFVFYAADGVTSKEYKVGAGGPPTTGVTADTRAPAGAWTAATVQKQATGDLNTFIVIP